MSVTTKINETIAWVDEKILESNANEQAVIRLARLRAALNSAKDSTGDSGGGAGTGGSSGFTETQADELHEAFTNLSKVNNLGQPILNLNDWYNLRGHIENLYNFHRFSNSISQTADNAAISGVSSAPGFSVSYYIHNVTFSYDDTPDGPKKLILAVDGTPFFQTTITSSGTGPLLLNYTVPNSKQFTYSLEASGTDGNFGTLNILYNTITNPDEGG